MPSGQESVAVPARPGNFGFPVVRESTIKADPWTTFRTWILIATFGALMALQGSGVILAGPVPTVAACAAILLFGLPHGTLDLTIIRREREVGQTAMCALLLCYIGLAVMMGAVWQWAPVAALAIFIFIAVVHFAEDWREIGSAFLAQGMAIALLAAPTLLHLAQMEQLFVALAGHSEAALVANVLLLLAPTSLAVATVAIWTLLRTGRDDQAMVGAITLAGMILLPPVVGFALFFCLYHSPSQLQAAVARAAEVRSSRRTIALLTLAAIGIAALLFAGEVRAELPDQFVAASFMTLSLLTVPHMIVPMIVTALPHRVRGRPASGRTQARDPATVSQSSTAAFERRG